MHRRQLLGETSELFGAAVCTADLKLNVVLAPARASQAISQDQQEGIVTRDRKHDANAAHSSESRPSRWLRDRHCGQSQRGRGRDRADAKVST